MLAKKWIENFALTLTSTRQQPLSSTIFFKAIVCFALVRLILIWNLGNAMLHYHTISLPHSILGKIALAPAYLANSHPSAFQSIAGALLLIILIVGPNYIMNVLFCWLVLNLVIVYLPFGNGSDLILLMLSVWCIPLQKKMYSNQPLEKRFKSRFSTLVDCFVNGKSSSFTCHRGLIRYLQHRGEQGRRFSSFATMKVCTTLRFPGSFKIHHGILFLRG